MSGLVPGCFFPLTVDFSPPDNMENLSKMWRKMQIMFSTTNLAIVISIPSLSLKISSRQNVVCRRYQGSHVLNRKQGSEHNVLLTF